MLLRLLVKELDKVKNCFSGAGAAGQAIARLLIKMRVLIKWKIRRGQDFNV